MKTGPPLIHHSYAYCLMRVYKVFRHFGEYSTKDEKHLAFLFFPEGHLSMAPGTIHPEYRQALTPCVSLLFPFKGSFSRRVSWSRGCLFPSSLVRE